MRRRPSRPIPTPIPPPPVTPILPTTPLNLATVDDCVPGRYDLPSVPGEVQAFGENVLFEVADLPCGWDMCDEPLVVGYCVLEWLVKGK